MLFSDRLEVWNPGELPASLTPEPLTRPNASIPRNPLLAGPLFLEGYIEFTIPDKPQSRLQKYRLTAKGRAWLVIQSRKP